jgi:hypothetical protein
VPAVLVDGTRRVAPYLMAGKIDRAGAKRQEKVSTRNHGA